MLKNRFANVVALAIFAVGSIASSCNCQEMNIVDDLHEIRSKDLLSPNPSDLLSSDSFLKLWRNSDKYVAQAGVLLTTHGLASDERWILMLAMQNLPFDRYVVLCEKVVNAWINRQVSDQELLDSVLLPTSISNRLSFNYRNARVVSLLTQIQSSLSGRDNAAQISSQLEIISSGRARLYGMRQQKENPSAFFVVDPKGVDQFDDVDRFIEQVKMHVTITLGLIFCFVILVVLVIWRTASKRRLMT